MMMEQSNSQFGMDLVGIVYNNMKVYNDKFFEKKYN